MIIMVTGGARSGKSTFAEKTVEKFGQNIAYVATAIPFDDEMNDRIKKHKQQRPSNWTTIEACETFSDLKSNTDFLSADGILLDCLTVFITNKMIASDLDFDHCTVENIDALELAIEAEMDQLVKIIGENGKQIVIVTNEVGLGLVPPYPMGRFFRDIAGRMNQKLALQAEEVYFVISGIPMKIK